MSSPVIRNRKARHDYHIDDTVEAGIVLQGTEVKSVRQGKVQMVDAFCRVERGEMKLLNLHISPYEGGNRNNHEPTRTRTLLMKRREIEKFAKGIEQKGYSIIPLKIYFKNGFAKVEIGLARGKKLYDKRHDIAARDADRRLRRIKRSGGVDE
jgi:SsrA-binding protein